MLGPFYEPHSNLITRKKHRASKERRRARKGSSGWRQALAPTRVANMAQSRTSLADNWVEKLGTRLRSLQIVKIPKYQKYKSPKCPYTKMPKYQNAQSIKMPKYQNVQMPKCQIVKMPKSQNIKMANGWGWGGGLSTVGQPNEKSNLELSVHSLAVCCFPRQ